MNRITWFLLFAIVICFFDINAQNQIGEDITFGENNSYEFGRSVSVSSDGSRMITGHLPTNGIGTHEVRVFENIEGTWSQLGQTITREGYRFGSSVAISDNGSRIAIYSRATAAINFSYGHVRVYEYNGTEWSQLGDIISGESDSDELGSSMSFSSDGSVLATGTPGKKDANGYSVGGVQIFKFNNNQWEQLGQSIIGGTVSSFADKLGESVSISNDGNRLAVGGSEHSIYFPDVNAYSLYRGVVRIFDYNLTTNNWEQLGNDITGERTRDRSGSSVSISSDGTTVAIGARSNDINGFDSSGHVRVYKYNIDSWSQVGQDIDGERSYHYLGTSVSLSGDGKHLVTGTASVTLTSITIPALIKIYKYSESDNNWSLFRDIEINTTQGSQSMFLSEDGSTLAFQNRIISEFVVQAYKVGVNEISGKLSVDFGNNGCLSEFIPLEGIKVSATKDDEIISTYTDIDGNYSLLIDIGSYDITMDPENEFEFIDFTEIRNVNFNDLFNVETVDFCLTSNITIENELEVDAVGFPTTRSLSLNKDGSILAVGVNNFESFTGPGYVEVFDYIDEEFIQKGETLTGDSDDGQFGNSISLSSSGNRIAIGAPYNFGAPSANGEGGEVKVYDYINNTWVQVGQDIQGVSEDNLGYSVSMSADGSRVGIGIPEFRDNGSNAGKVEIYELINGSWVQLGATINNGIFNNEHFGVNISLSKDGNHIAISEERNPSVSESVKVRVYKYNEGIDDWEQIGNSFEGNLEQDFDHASVSLSENGSVLAISASSGWSGSSNYVKIFQYDNEEWVQLGDNIVGFEPLATMSGDGKRVVIANEELVSGGAHRYLSIYDYNGLNWEPFGVNIVTSSSSTEISEDGTRLAVNDDLSEVIQLYDIGGNTVTGNVFFDDQNNNCSNFSLPARNLKVNATLGSATTTTTFTNEVGFYKFSIKNDGMYNIQVADSRFDITPNSSELEFMGVEGKKVADFCVSANTIENDVLVTLLPITEARPGFDAVYQIVYENIGTTISEGNIEFEFNNMLQSFVSSTEPLDAQTINSLTYNYNNLQPFESRTIDIILNTEPPSTVNDGDILPLSVVITSDETDINLSDNNFEFNQIVVNSFDPNDKQVVQGSRIAIEEIDEYLHYIIRFQNSGTASAINVRVRDALEDELDWDTFIPVSSSHAYTTQITQGNLVDFIFENILLPPEQDDESESHGFVAFKIKPKADVVVGDVIVGNAEIYFDFNSPIVTNTVSTEIVDNSLSANENRLEDSFKFYPNPTNDIIYLSTKSGVHIEAIKVFSVTGKLFFEEHQGANEINLKSLPKGIYFLNVVLNKGNVTKKIIKN